jgi:DnaK suppressor protein
MSKTSGAKASKAKASVGKAAAKNGTSTKALKARAALKPVTAKKAEAGKAAPKTAAVKGPARGRSQPAKPVVVSKAASAPARTIATAKATTAKKTEGPTKKMVVRPKIADIVLPPGYRPSESEPFMNEMHRAYFRKRLLEWKDEILRQTRETLAILHEDSTQHADLADRATSETDRATELRTRDRQRKLIAKIDAALGRIEDGSYGYCEDTGEPIGLKRLDARPIATLSVEAQERHERRERVYREE